MRDIKIQDIDVVVLCGGLGMRLQSVIGDPPKPMVEINGRPFLDILIDYVAKYGFTRFILCTGYKGDFIRRYYEKNNSGLTRSTALNPHPSGRGGRRRSGSTLSKQQTSGRGVEGLIFLISEEGKPLGTAGAIKNAEPFIESDIFLVVNGDSLCEIDLKDFLSFHIGKRAFISIALTTIKSPGDFGVVKLNRDQKIIAFSEKTLVEGDGLVNAGMYFFDGKILEEIPSDKKLSLEYDFFPGILDKEIYGYVTDKELLDIGTPERLERAMACFSETKK